MAYTKKIIYTSPQVLRVHRDHWAAELGSCSAGVVTDWWHTCWQYKTERKSIQLVRAEFPYEISFAHPWEICIGEQQNDCVLGMTLKSFGTNNEMLLWGAAIYAASFDCHWSYATSCVLYSSWHAHWAGGRISYNMYTLWSNTHCRI